MTPGNAGRAQGAVSGVEIMTRTETIYHFIIDYQLEKGRPPTIREIGAACDISSTSVVNYHLGKLEASGHISREPRLSRAIRVL